MPRPLPCFRKVKGIIWALSMSSPRCCKVELSRRLRLYYMPLVKPLCRLPIGTAVRRETVQQREGLSSLSSGEAVTVSSTALGRNSMCVSSISSAASMSEPPLADTVSSCVLVLYVLVLGPSADKLLRSSRHNVNRQSTLRQHPKL